MRAVAVAAGAILGALGGLAPATPAHAGPLLCLPVICWNPPPQLGLATSGLVAGRDFAITTTDAPRTIEIGRRESFAVGAVVIQSDALVRLVGNWTLTCSDNGNVETRQAVDTGFVASPATYSASIPCNGHVTRATLTLHAEALDQLGTTTSTPTATFDHLSRAIVADAVVHESDTGVQTGLTVLPGDQLSVTAEGSIWSGWWFGPATGPDGDWPGNPYGSCTGASMWSQCNAGPGYPKPTNAPRYSLLATPTGLFYVGSRGARTESPWGAGALMLRTNDDWPGNGWGQFNVHVVLYR